MTRSKLALAWLLISLPLAGTFAAENAPANEKPKRTGLVEKAGVRLVQLDVTLSGKPEVLSRLTRDDLEVWLGNRQVKDFHLDIVGSASNAQVPEEGQATRGAPRPATYLFYFDQRHLTVAGRLRALQLAEELIPKLIVNESRGMVVSNGKRLSTFAQPTSDPSVLLAAVQKVREDLDHQDLTAGLEEMHVADLEREILLAKEEDESSRAELHAMYRLLGPPPEKGGGSGSGRRGSGGGEGGSLGSGSGGSPTFSSAGLQVALAIERVRKQNQEAVDARDAKYAITQRVAGAARRFEQDELWQAEVDLQCLASALGCLVDVDAPKAVLYFADTMRRNAGEHYLRMVPDAIGLRGVRLSKGEHKIGTSAPRIVREQSFGADVRFEEVIREASAHGIRFYSVQAEGLVPPNGRMKDAQDTLVTLALDTGGEPFLNGIPAPKVAGRILDDLSRLGIISFEPTGFPEDEPLSVRIRPHLSGVKVQARSTLVVPSEKSRLSTRLRAAFTNPEATRRDIPLRANLIPIGYRDGAYSALVQVAVPGTGIAGATWDLGASLVSRGLVREDASARVSLKTPGAPLVLEREMRFAPGPYQIIAVAHETSTDQLASGQVDGSWPDLDDAPAAVGPIAVVQRTAGAFVRDEAVHTSGSLARGEPDPIRIDQPTAVIGLVCQRPGDKQAIRIERKLTGQTSVEFPPIDVQPSDDPCSQVRDMIPPGTMGPGAFKYEIRVLRGGEEVAKGEKIFSAIEKS